MGRRGNKQEILFEASLDISNVTAQINALRLKADAMLSHIITGNQAGRNPVTGRFQSSSPLSDTQKNAAYDELRKYQQELAKLNAFKARLRISDKQDEQRATDDLRRQYQQRALAARAYIDDLKTLNIRNKEFDRQYDAAIKRQNLADKTRQESVQKLIKSQTDLQNSIRKTNAQIALQDQRRATEVHRTGTAANAYAMSGMRLNDSVLARAGQQNLRAGVLGEGEAWAGKIAVEGKLQKQELAQLEMYYKEYRAILKTQNYAVLRDLETYLAEEGILLKKANAGRGGGPGGSGGNKGLGRFMYGSGGLSGGISGSASLMGVNLYGLAAVGGIAQLIKSSISAYTDVFASKNMLAGIVQTFSNFRGPDGKNLSPGQNFVQAQRYSQELYQDVKKKSIESPLTQQELMDMYTASMPFLARQGVNFKQGIGVSNDVAVLAKMMGLDINRVKDDIRNVSMGQLKNAQTFQAMGFDKGDMKKLASLKGDDFIKFFNDKMEGYKYAMKNFADSFVPKWDNMMTELYQTGARFGEKFAPAILKGVDHIMEAMDKWEKDGSLDKFAENITKLIETLSDAVGYVLQNFETITKALKVYFGTKLLGIIVLFLAKAQAAATGGTIAGGANAGGAGVLGTAIGAVGAGASALIAGGATAAWMGWKIVDDQKQNEEAATKRAKDMSASGAGYAMWEQKVRAQPGKTFGEKLASMTHEVATHWYGSLAGVSYDQYLSMRSRNQLQAQGRNAFAGAMGPGSKNWQKGLKNVMKDTDITGDDKKGKKVGSGIGATQITPDVTAEENRIGQIDTMIEALQTQKYSLDDNDYGTRQNIDAQIAQLQIQKAGAERDRAHKLATKQIQYTQGGNPISGLNPAFDGPLQEFLKASGGKVRVKSGYRSPERSDQLYAADLAKYGKAHADKFVGKGGHSNHNFGLAADLDFGPGGRAWAHTNAAKFGLHFPMSWENWHVEKIGLNRRTVGQELKVGNMLTKDANAVAQADAQYANKIAQINAEQAKARKEAQNQELARYNEGRKNRADVASGYSSDNLDEIMSRAGMSTAEKMTAIQQAERNEIVAFRTNSSMGVDELMLGVGRIRNKYRKMRESVTDDARSSMNDYNKRLGDERGQKLLSAWQNKNELVGLTGTDYTLKAIDQKIQEKQGLMSKFPNWTPALAPLIEALQKQREAIMRNTQALVYSYDKRTQANVTNAFGNMGFQTPTEKYKAGYDDQIANIDRMQQAGDTQGLIRAALGRDPKGLGEMIKYSSMSPSVLASMAKYRASQGLSYSGRVQADYKTQLQEGGMAALQALASGQDVAGAFASKYNNILGNDALQRLLGGRSSYTTFGVTGHSKWGIPSFGNKFNKGAFSRDLISGGGGMAAQMLVGMLGQNNYSQEGSSIGGMLAGAGAFAGLGAWAGPVGILAGGLLGALFGKKKHQEEDPNIVAHRKRLEELLSSINNRLKPQEDVFRGIRGDVLFGSASRLYSGRTSLLGARMSLGVL